MRDGISTLRALHQIADRQTHRHTHTLLIPGRRPRAERRFGCWLFALPGWMSFITYEYFRLAAANNPRTMENLRYHTDAAATRTETS